jgi:hypothetical protein
MFSWSEYKTHFAQSSFVYFVSRSIALVCLSSLLTIYARQYADLHASNPVTDLVLSNIRAYDVGGIFIFGGIGMIVLTAIVVLSRPNYIPFATSTIALFYMTRSICITLTHIKPSPTIIDHSYSGTILESISDSLYNGSDLFFSGHVGLPFLMALIFWNIPLQRYVFLCLSVFFAFVVLLGHIHYSIDVFSAYFITYTIYHISAYTFRQEYVLFFKPADVLTNSKLGDAT